MKTEKDFREVLIETVDYIGVDNFLNSRLVLSCIKYISPSHSKEIKYLCLLYDDGIVDKLYKDIIQGMKIEKFIGKYIGYLEDVYGTNPSVARKYLECIAYAVSGRNLETNERECNDFNLSVELEIEELCNKGCKEFSENKYSEAAEWFRKAAEKGHVTAQYQLGYMYYNGEGVERNNIEAIKWFKKAAEKGHVTAQYQLGYMYSYGEGVEKDYIEAIKWYKKAAAQGHSMAQHQIEVVVSNEIRAQENISTELYDLDLGEKILISKNIRKIKNKLWDLIVNSIIFFPYIVAFAGVIYGAVAIVGDVGQCINVVKLVSDVETTNDYETILDEVDCLTRGELSVLTYKFGKQKLLRNYKEHLLTEIEYFKYNGDITEIDEIIDRASHYLAGKDVKELKAKVQIE